MKRVKIPFEQYERENQQYVDDFKEKVAAGDYKAAAQILEDHGRYMDTHGVTGTEIRDLEGHIVADASDLDIEM